MAGHVVKIAVETPGEPFVEPDFGGGQGTPGYADLLKPEFPTPDLDLRGELLQVHREVPNRCEEGEQYNQPHDGS